MGSDSPTHVPTCINHAADVLDIAVIQALHVPAYLKVLYDTDTQHFPIFLTLSSAIELKAPRTCIKINWELYKENLIAYNLPCALSTREDIETAAKHWMSTISTAKEKSSQVIERSTTFLREILPDHIRKKLREKRRLRKRWLFSRYPTPKNN